MLHVGGAVPVTIIPEPDNPVDNNAVAFQCKVDDKWHTFGYAVTEVTDDLYSALQNNLIVSIGFKDVRFVCIWSRSAPGFYAAVNITKKRVGGLPRDQVC